VVVDIYAYFLKYVPEAAREQGTEETADEAEPAP